MVDEVVVEGVVLLVWAGEGSVGARVVDVVVVSLQMARGLASGGLSGARTLIRNGVRTSGSGEVGGGSGGVEVVVVVLGVVKGDVVGDTAGAVVVGLVVERNRTGAMVVEVVVDLYRSGRGDGGTVEEVEVAVAGLGVGVRVLVGCDVLDELGGAGLGDEGSTTLTSLVFRTTSNESGRPGAGGGPSVIGGGGVGGAVLLKKILITSCRFSVETGDARETCSSATTGSGVTTVPDGCLTDTEVTTASTTSGARGTTGWDSPSPSSRTTPLPVGPCSGVW